MGSTRRCEQKMDLDYTCTGSWGFPGNVEQQGPVLHDGGVAFLQSQPMPAFRRAKAVTSSETQVLQSAVKYLARHRQSSTQVRQADEVMCACSSIQLVKGTIE